MSLPDLRLGDGESIVDDSDELVYRQITAHMQTPDGQIGSHAFGASNADRGMPSYSRSSRVAAQEARDWHTLYANSPSLGVWGLTVGEVLIAGRFVVDDSATPEAPDAPRSPGHCFVDYREATPYEIKSARAVLLMAALQRGEIPTKEPRDPNELQGIDDETA